MTDFERMVTRVEEVIVSKEQAKQFAIECYDTILHGVKQDLELDKEGGDAK